LGTWYSMEFNSYVSSAISCGVWGRMCTFAWERGVETVAVGF
jgi:hypothetical protein